jgi:uncharacterized membrane protein YphA (DoxX/SURF4 family)
MNEVLHQCGRVFFAIALADFGIQYLGYGRFVRGLPPVPPWVPGGSVLAYVVGVILVAAAVSIAVKRKARISAIIAGLLFVLSAVLLHTLHLRHILFTGDGRTGAFEALSLGGAGLLLAGTLPVDRPSSPGGEAFVQKLAHAGRFIFGFSMLVFGWQHFKYAEFIASLIPTWIPGHLFWDYFFGWALIAAGVAIIIKVQGRLGAALLGFMFLLWVVVLHAPRSITAFNNGDEWASLFVALGLSGGSFVIAAAMPSGRSGGAVSKA